MARTTPSSDSRRAEGGAPACGVHLSPYDGDLAAVACADHSAYVYDLRRAAVPLLQLPGHARAVSYVRWLAADRLVTASTDSALRWALVWLGVGGVGLWVGWGFGVTDS